MRNKLYNKRVHRNKPLLSARLFDWLIVWCGRSVYSVCRWSGRETARSLCSWHELTRRSCRWPATCFLTFSTSSLKCHDARTDTHRENEVWNSDHDTRPPEGYLRRLGKYELSVRVKYTNVNNDNNINTIVMKHVLYGMQNRHSHRSVIFYWCSKQSDKLKTIPLIITQWILPIKLTAPSILNSSNITIFLIIRTLISGLCSTTSLCSFFSSCNCSLTMHSLHLWK